MDRFLSVSTIYPIKSPSCERGLSIEPNVNNLKAVFDFYDLATVI